MKYLSKVNYVSIVVVWVKSFVLYKFVSQIHRAESESKDGHIFFVKIERWNTSKFGKLLCFIHQTKNQIIGRVKFLSSQPHNLNAIYTCYAQQTIIFFRLINALTYPACLGHTESFSHVNFYDRNVDHFLRHKKVFHLKAARKIPIELLDAMTVPAATLSSHSPS